MSRSQQSRMWTPRRGRQQLDLLCHDKRPELRGKCPVLPPVGVVIKLPEMDELVDRASVGLEVAHELLVVAALLERREAELLVELRRFRHLADVECVRSQIHTAPSGILLHRSLIHDLRYPIIRLITRLSESLTTLRSVLVSLLAHTGRWRPACSSVAATAFLIRHCCRPTARYAPAAQDSCLL